MNYEEQFPYILTAKHVQEILGVGKEKAYQLMDGESFPVIKIGRHKKVQREAFFRWIKSHEKEVI
ncbi:MULTISPECIES: helix-turn-helix domain-containing protein [Priestia]|uniref:helix-turn-helix domain-containing protein n=1 Tax=Priestia TaxID=2800373 RepID=UPI000BF6E2FB|nr:helix-turn-helix domain-containing protein [Priestia megaterium]PFI93375.1 DNA-binding protein [Priestia megaterium]PGR11808.1 DNA-binding protein [Priestia megaterium]